MTMRSVLHHRYFPWIFLPAVCLLSALLWLPSWQNPIVSDTSLYALLGESFWTTGRYAVLGELHGKHLPFHAIASYPLVWALGYGTGMKFSSLFAGFGVLIAAYFLFKRALSREVAVLTVLAIAFHYGFVVMTMLGSADLLFTFLFLLSLHAYLNAEKEPRWYLAVSILLGLACLTRYNGVPLFLVFPLYTLWKRPRHFWSPLFLGSMVLGAAIFSTWFIRAYFAFGALTNDYTTELQGKTAGPLAQIFISLKYYLHPFGNILPILFLFSLYGLYRERRQSFLIVFMIGVWSLFLIWPVLNIRYTFPGYIILLAFAFLGVQDLLRRFPRVSGALVTLILASVIALDVFALCAYTYGSCNVILDRNLPGFPKHLGFASEGFYTWDQARDYLNAHAEPGAEVTMLGPVNAAVFARDHVFREDLGMQPEGPSICPSYRITQEMLPDEISIFQTVDVPVTYVAKRECK